MSSPFRSGALPFALALGAVLGAFTTLCFVLLVLTAGVS